MALRHTQEQVFTAVVANREHGAIKDAIDMRVLIYDTQTGDRDPGSVAYKVKRMLANA